MRNANLLRRFKVRFTRGSCRICNSSSLPPKEGVGCSQTGHRLSWLCRYQCGTGFGAAAMLRPYLRSI
jgi:hypothetical protein